jgi:hypothetical protein
MNRLSVNIHRIDRVNIQNHVQEHIQAIRNNNINSGYSNNILNSGTTTDTTDIVRTGNNGKHLNNLEKYHTYLISKDNLHMNDTHAESHNPAFEALYGLDTR